MSGGEIRVDISRSLSGAEAGEAAAFLEASPAASHLQRPDWPDYLDPAPRHRYLVLRARAGGALVGLALARLGRLAPGFHLAVLRRGPVTHAVADLARVVPAMAQALRREGVCSLVVNPRWQEAEAEAATALLAGLSAQELPRAGQSMHRATLLVDLSGTPEALTARLKPRCRRQINRATALGLEVRPAASLDEVLAFEPVFRDFHRRRGLGTEAIPPPAQQWALTRDRGALLLGYYRGRAVCGHGMLADGPRATWLSLASAEDLHDLPHDYALIWQALLAAQAQGLRWFDMAGAPSRRDADPAGPDRGQMNRQQFKTAFAPAHVELVPMMALGLRQPAHGLLFGLRQHYRGWKAGRRPQP